MSFSPSEAQNSNNDNQNHNNGRVIVVGIIQERISFLLGISFSFRLDLAIKEMHIVSNNIVTNHA